MSAAALVALFLCLTFIALGSETIPEDPVEAEPEADDFAAAGETLVLPGSERRTGRLVQVGHTELIPGDLIVACKTLTMDGEVKGDLLAGGVYLTIRNMVGKDLTAGGYNIEVQGHVIGDARVAGANIEIDGIIDGDLVAFGGNVTILGDVKGDVMTGGGKVRISGSIQGGLDARCGDMVIDGTIGKNVALTASRVTLSPTAVLNGNLTYTSSRSADIAQGAQIAGEVKREADGSMMVFWRLASMATSLLPEYPERWRNWRNQFPVWFRTLLGASSFVSLLIAGIIILSFYRRHATMVADRIVSFPLRSFELGLLFLICVPIGALILCITIIGLPIGLIALAAYLVLFYVSRVYVALAMGREILDRITKQDVRIIWPMVLGLFIITALSLIPYYIGWVIKLICIILGLGGMTMTGRRIRVASREEAG